MGSQALTVDTDVALAMGVDVEETAATVDETGAFLTADRSSMSVAEQYEFDRMVRAPPNLSCPTRPPRSQQGAQRHQPLP